MNIYRELGRTGIKVNAMALGCYSMSNAYGKRSDDESIAVIHKAIDAGINLLDTADYYGAGHNERLLSNVLKDRRDEVVLSSKFGYVRQPDGSLTVTGRPAHVRKACEDTLRRLKVDHLDLYFQHRVDHETPIEETVGAMSELVQQGKVRYLGLCEAAESTLRRAHAVHPITAMQAEYSLWTRDIEGGLLDVCDDMGVSLMAFSPLARGMLTGALRSLDQLGEGDVRKKYPRFSAENFPRNVALVDQMGEIAKSLGCSYSQLALSWLFHKAPRLIAICGCDTLEFLSENIGALNVSLSDAQVEQIGEMFAPGKVFGDRYHTEMMRMLDTQA